MKIDEFIDAWEKIPTDESLENTRIYWNMRASEFNEQNRDNCGEIQDLLDQQNYKVEGKSMLDIGCGPGKCAVRFSRDFKYVTGVDISDQMIAYAKENAEEESRKNVEFHAMAWEKADLEALNWEDRFDVVVGSMTPAISNVNALKKMCRASKDLCMLSSFVHRRDLKVELEEHLGLSKPGQEYRNKVYLVFNILWLMGYHPQVWYTDVGIRREYTLEKAHRLYSQQLELNQTQKKKAKTFLESRAVDDILHQEYTAKIGWLVWSVKK
ncbi:class I SAM-dependent methyltransferase [Alkalibacter rhizosphaerae]|uniref:Class I SAM-dependent methyltransferase n=1 Tax=Alkalibacter rhizosphaerae TaxID=2815577 RepID=A0A975AHS7_9FIRM|nr:class I SAM-dependent methyltransferase [Alkalibacter rhizosphaerae]QSX07929.1 class I SAM-dependent methyltransferase [Alkalibacter rhizosphaerae]